MGELAGTREIGDWPGLFAGFEAVGPDPAVSHFLKIGLSGSEGDLVFQVMMKKTSALVHPTWLQSGLIFSVAAPLLAQTATLNPLDFPSDPLDFPFDLPTIGNPPALPPFIFPPLPPTGSDPSSTSSDLFLVDGSLGFFNAAGWEDASGQSPSPLEIRQYEPINRNLIIDGIDVAPRDLSGRWGDVINLGTGSLTMTNAGFDPGSPASVLDPSGEGGWIYGTFGGGATLILIQSSMILNDLSDLSISLQSSSMELFQRRSDLAQTLSNSTVDLSEMSTLSLVEVDSHAGDPAPLEPILENLLGRITVDGLTPVLGSDPVAFERGDNLIARPVAGQQIDPSTGEVLGEWTAGWQLGAIPEPSTLLLAILAVPGLLRRSRH